jgi:hypothetical protein
LKPHSAFSVTKSFVGTLAAMLAAEGVIDPAAPVTRYLPEMKNTAYGDATVRQVMDMTIGAKFSEDYADPNVGPSQALCRTPRGATARRCRR